MKPTSCLVAGGLLALVLSVGGQAAEEEALSVSVQPLSQLVFHPERSAPAEVTPLNDARLSAEISARVMELPVKVGQQVEQGELVARLDCSDYKSRFDGQRATLRAMRIRLDLARTQLQRARNLSKQRNISEEIVDQRETELSALRAELEAQKKAEEQARLQVGRCKLQAPYAAVVAERLASQGDMAAPGTPLLRLVQLLDAEVSARLRPDRAEAAAKAQQPEFDWLGQRYPLRLLRKMPLVDRATRTMELRFGFVAEAPPPGASGRLRWREADAYLPADLLVRRDAGLGVFLLRDGKAVFHLLQQAREGQPAGAESLPRDARVILEGRESLRQGMAVRQSAAEG